MREATGVRVHCLHHPGEIGTAPGGLAESAVGGVGKTQLRIGRTRYRRTVYCVQGLAKGWLERSVLLIPSRERALGLLWLVRAPFCIIRSASPVANSSRPNTTGRLQAERWRSKGGWIDSRHPYPRLVDLEEIRYERVEIDVRVSKIVEGQLLPVPAIGLLAIIHQYQGWATLLTFGTQRRGFPY